MGLFSRFFVQALPCTAEGTQCRVRDTTSLVPRVYGTNRSNSNTSCSSNDGPTKNGRDCSRPFSLSDALPSRRRGAGRRGRQRGLSAVQERGDVADGDAPVDAAWPIGLLLQILLAVTLRGQILRRHLELL